MSDHEVRIHRNNLRTLLDPKTIPTSGPLYRAVYPLLPLFIFYATLEEEDDLVKVLIHSLRQNKIFMV